MGWAVCGRSPVRGEGGVRKVLDHSCSWDQVWAGDRAVSGFPPSLLLVVGGSYGSLFLRDHVLGMPNLVAHALITCAPPPPTDESIQCYECLNLNGFDSS
jgi:hypothetical protein